MCIGIMHFSVCIIFHSEEKFLKLLYKFSFHKINLSFWLQLLCWNNCLWDIPQMNFMWLLSL